LPVSIDPWTGRRTRQSHDPQIANRRVPAVFPQGQSEDRQAPQSRHLQVAGGGGKARTRRAVFQAALIWVYVLRDQIRSNVSALVLMERHHFNFSLLPGSPSAEALIALSAT